MTQLLGGFRITDVQWVGPLAIAVTVETDYTDRYLQLYAGRRLIGVTDTAGELTVIGQLQPAHCPHALIVVMCEEGEQLDDVGDQLPPRPYNQFDLAWEADSYPDDAKWFEITAATEADGAVDPDNVIARVKYIGDGQYAFLLPPINEPGEWAYTLTPRDDAEPSGTAGDPADIAEDALPYPPDVAIDDDGVRLTAEIDTGVLTVAFAYDWEE